MKIDAIKVGVRYRRDLGDIAGLACSIAEVGLLHPVVVTSDGTLVAGARRIAAFRMLGQSEIPATVVDLGEIVRGEWAENAHRKDFQPTEIEAIYRKVAPLERAAAQARMKAGKADPGEPFARVEGRAPRTSDKIGAFAGVSGRTVEKIVKVADAARAEPQRFGGLLEVMDEKGVGPAYAQVRRARRHQAIADKALLTPAVTHIGGPFSLIYADPPWKWGHFGEADQENEAGKGRTPDQHYPTLTYDQIKAFAINGKPIRDLAHKYAAVKKSSRGHIAESGSLGLGCAGRIYDCRIRRLI